MHATCQFLSITPVLEGFRGGEGEEVCERDRDRDRDRDKDRDRDRQRQRDRETETEKERHGGIETEKQRQRDRDKARENDIRIQGKSGGGEAWDETDFEGAGRGVGRKIKGG